jgi:DNA-nicking Smr family endonuclease
MQCTRVRCAIMHDDDTSGRDDSPEAHVLPIDGVLDLHTFQAREVPELVRDYIAVCKERNIRHVRIIHGKGRGVLRRTVHAALKRMTDVAFFSEAGIDAGGWGATIVHLKD